jgi:hypothetical protein
LDCWPEESVHIDDSLCRILQGKQLLGESILLSLADDRETVAPLLIFSCFEKEVFPLIVVSVDQ